MRRTGKEGTHRRRNRKNEKGRKQIGRKRSGGREG